MFIKTIFAMVDPSRPTEGERIVHGLHYLAGKDCARACYVVVSVRKALTAPLWVNQCKNGFNKSQCRFYCMVGKEKMPLKTANALIKYMV